MILQVMEKVIQVLVHMMEYIYIYNYYNKQLTKVPFEKPVKQSPTFLSQVKKGLVFDNADAVLTPGVGSYNLYKGIVPKTSKCGEFDTTEPRFNYKYNGAPGPGTYEPNVASFPPVRKLPQGAREEDIPKIPFHSTTFRFDQGRDEEVPGAGSYRIPSFLEYLFIYCLYLLLVNYQRRENQQCLTLKWVDLIML